MTARDRFLFIGVSTGGSSIRRIFPRWMATLGIEARLEGCDIPLGAEADSYRRVVQRIRDEPDIRGALVTSHKIDLLRASRDLFDELDSDAELCGEVSCIVRRDGRLLGFAKDPMASGRALDDFVPAGHWTQGEGDALCIGGGGAAIAISVSLAGRARSGPHPRRFIAADIAEERLLSMRAMHAKLETPLRFAYHLVSGSAENDALLAGLPAGSLVINATGMGKDLPGSPISDQARFPRDGLVWELNYRGERSFMRQAEAQAVELTLTIEDGWRYFLHGWTSVLAEVYGFELDARRFNELAAAAQGRA